MSKIGHFIVVEGLEGAGKSTALATIKQFLTQQVDEFITTREPGGTAIGEVIRELIKHPPQHEHLDSRAELLLLYTSRVQLIEQVIKPALKRGASVLADRFELSTYAYQGGGRGLDIQMIQQLSKLCVEGISPNLILFLDVDPEIGLTRAQSRGHSDRIERESLVFFESVRRAYHETIKKLQQVVMIDANQPEMMVKQSITRALEHYFSAFNE
jgi:dTMP kinase